MVSSSLTSMVFIGKLGTLKSNGEGKSQWQMEMPTAASALY